MCSTNPVRLGNSARLIRGDRLPGQARVCNVSGEAAEAIGHRWLACDLDRGTLEHYVRASA